MTRWNIYYEMPNGNSGTWQEYATTKEEAIAKARQHHSTDMKRGTRITGASPA